MYGMLYSIKNFVSKMSPVDVTEGFQCYRTSKYMLNYYETPSGIKYVMNTDLNSISVRELLQQINSQVLENNQSSIIVTFFISSFQVYIEYCVKNPVHQPGKIIDSELFKGKLEALLKESPIFKS